MKIYDISQEVFSSQVYEGDPSPERKVIASVGSGSLYNLTAFSMCAHNGTHIDAPYHFISGGKTVDKLALESLIGLCYVTEHNGELNKSDAIDIIANAEKADPESKKRILIKGDCTVTHEAAKLFAVSGILLLGNESQTVGPADSPMEVHLELLGTDVILLEGIRLSKVPTGVYLLNAAPINLADSDGAPCRAVLIEI